MGFVDNTVRSCTFAGSRSKEFSATQFETTHELALDVIGNVLQADLVSFKTRDGVTLSGYWHQKNRDRPTVILFSGNSGIYNGFLNVAMNYKFLGFNVLLLEYRGYGRSSGEAGGPNQELEAYLDAAAALKFVLSKGISFKKVLAHGYSLGGAYAAALGYFFGLQHVILDHTFTSLAQLCQNKVSFLPWQKIMSHAFAPSSEGDSGSIADGFNSLAKVQKMEGEVFVISGKDDTLTPPQFGEALIKARYPNDAHLQKELHITIAGGHNDGGAFIDTEAHGPISSFLIRRGLFRHSAPTGIVEPH